jgi:hypothetical protein
MKDLATLSVPIDFALTLRAGALTLTPLSKVQDRENPPAVTVHHGVRNTDFYSAMHS